MTIRKFTFALLALSTFMASGAFAGDEPYVRLDQVDLTRILAPAPAADSPAAREDIKILLDIQSVRTPDLVALANADVDRTLSRFSEVMGADLSKEKAPLANALVDKAWANARPIVDAAKAYWKRTRPNLANADIKLVVPAETTPSYPSGHATYGTLTAIILANMVPEKATAIHLRGIAFGFSRLVGGIHYPSDVEASHIAGAVIAAQMMDNPQFNADLAKATTEVRGLLGLPALPSAPPQAANSNIPQAPAAAAAAK
ncbi:phosphatase PAP2 family protein [Xanthobacter sp. VNH20]|uniref:acid phosphatase n=1 Tax=Xanthobacter sp. VNH20 TaxID=3156616 RepID=UPI0032B4D6D2